MARLLQGEAWLCRQCRFLLVTADSVISHSDSTLQPDNQPSKCEQHSAMQKPQPPVNVPASAAAWLQASGSNAEPCAEAALGVLLVKPQRLMGQLRPGKDIHPDSSLYCPRSADWLLSHSQAHTAGLYACQSVDLNYVSGMAQSVVCCCRA